MKKTLLKVSLILFSIFHFPFSIHSQETFPVNGVFNKNHNYYAFTNARIVVDPQTTIASGTLLVRDGIIVACGEKVTVPAGAVTLDLKGKSIYPSLIDMYSSYGMPELKRAEGGRSPDSKIKGAYDWNQAIKPETDAYKLFTAETKEAEELRKLGFGAVLTSQKDGIARGSAALVSLADGLDNSLIIRDQAAALYSFDKGVSTQHYPSSLMGAIALLRQTYYDAQWYKAGGNKKEYNISLDAFNKLQALPQLFEGGDKLNSLRADKVGDEFRVQYIIKGSGNEYQRLDEIKNTFCRFIIPLNFPAAYDVEDPYDASMVSFDDLKHWELAPANPAYLEKKGVTFALTVSDLKDKSAFWKNLRKAIEYGMSEKQALRALTTIPAEMMGVTDKVGSLKPGMIASFLITSGSLFDEKNIIYENWVQGNQYKLNELNLLDIRGEYELSVGLMAIDEVFKLKITGEPDKPKGAFADSAKTSVSISVSGRNISLSFNLKSEGGTVRLAGSISDNPLRFEGKGQKVNGDWMNWKAVYKGPVAAADKKDTLKKTPPKPGDIIYPFGPYGYSKEDTTGIIHKVMHRWDAVLIKNATVWTNEAEGILKNKDVLIIEGKIVRIGDNLGLPKSVRAIEIDGKGKHLTPGIIDEHSHIAISGGANEGAQASSAEVSIGDVVNSEDVNIYRQLSGGVTAAQLLHGSANPIGGQSGLIKLRWGKSPEEMKIRNAPLFIKFALGENVKHSNAGDNATTRFPQTRMGVEQVFADHFTRAKEYEAAMAAYEKLPAKDKERTAPPRRNIELDALAEILAKKRHITCHSYVQSEILMLMALADSMGFKVNTFTHILEGYKLAEEMKKHGAGGSTFSDWWAYKMEVKEAIPYNSAMMAKMGIVTAVNSDDAEMGRRLNQEAAKAVKYGGLSEEEALKLVTLNPARLLHLDDKMGSIKPGKDGDLVLWSDNPLSIYAKAEKTLIDGVIYFDIETDKKMREWMNRERARLIQKMIAEKSGGAATQKPVGKQQKLYHCDSEEDDYLHE